MAKGTYDVSENAPPAKDGSFRSCLCAMLVFVAICIILLLAAWPWRSTPNKPETKEYTGAKEFLTEYPDVQTTSKPEIAEFTTEGDLFYTRSDYISNISKSPVIMETTTNIIKEVVIVLNDSKTENIPVTTTLPFVSTRYITEEENNSEVVTVLNDSKTENMPLTTTLPYVYTRYINEEENNSEVDIPTTATTELNLDITLTSTALINTTEYILNTNEEISNSTPTDLTSTTVDTTTLFESTILFTTTERTNEAISTDQVFVSNTSKSNQTHENLIEEATEQPQEEETDDFDVIETDNLPLRTMQTTTSSDMLNEAYNNNTVDDRASPKTSTTTTTESNRKRNDETNKETRKETTSSTLLSVRKQQKPVCQDLGCKTTAARMLTRIKHSGDPCEDFYEYACGGDNFDNIAEDNWKRITIKLQEINDNSSAYLKIFQKFHRSCVSFHTEFNYERRVKEAMGILHSVSRLYDRTQQIPGQLTLTELLTRLLLLGSSPLFDISMDANKQHFVFQMLPGKGNSFLHDETILPHPQEKCFRNLNNKFSQSSINLNETYIDYKRCISNHSDYLKIVEKALKVFGEFSYLDDYNATWHIQEIRTVIEWDILSKLDALTEASSLRHDIISRKYKTLKISDLEIRYPEIKWNILFSNLVGKSINNDAVVHIYFENYFDDLFKDFLYLPNRSQYNALLGMFAHELYTTLVLPVQTEDYEIFCLRQTSGLLKEISSSMYLETWTKSDISSAQKDLVNTFANVKARVTNKIKDAEWLDEISKSSVLEKLDSMQVAFGNSDSLKNHSYLNTKFINSFDGYNETYPQYAIALIKQNNKFSYALWGENTENSINDCMWWHYLTPYSMKPLSIYSTNSIVVPLGMLLNVPKNIPRYIHLAKIGYPIAKAIGHHFDTIGINYDVELATNALKTYHSLKTCSLDKYPYTMSHAVYDKQIYFRISGKISLNERIVEDMAIEVMLDMSAEVINDTLLPWISDNYSLEKVFLLAMAQQHCEKVTLRDYMIRLFESEHMPPSLLVRSFYANNLRFIQTFDCPRGSVMNHPMKCQSFFDLTPEDDYNY